MNANPKGEVIGRRTGSSAQWTALASSPYLSAAAELIVCTAAWAARRNTNGFYVILLTTTYIFFQFVLGSIRTRIMSQILLLFFLLYLPHPRPTMPKVVEDVANRQNFRVIPPGGSRDYRFMLQGIRDHAPQCGPMQAGELFIQGTRLDGVALRATNVQIAQQKSTLFYPPDPVARLRAHMGFPSGIPAELNVTLLNTANVPMTVMFGPEISGQTIYGEAVYMRFQNDKCVIVLHSTPAVTVR